MPRKYYNCVECNKKRSYTRKSQPAHCGVCKKLKPLPCRDCGTQFDSRLFVQHKTHTNGFDTICKLCHSKRQEGKQNSLRTKKYKILIQLKNNPCVDCGKIYHHSQMDFDHVRGEKKFQLGWGLRARVSQTELNAEISKCDLVCSNCHRLRTYARKVWKSDSIEIRKVYAGYGAGLIL